MVQQGNGQAGLGVHPAHVKEDGEHHDVDERAEDAEGVQDGLRRDEIDHEGHCVEYIRENI